MRFLQRLNSSLSGQPDNILTLILVLIAGAALAIARFGDSTLKLATTLWLLLP